MMDRNLVGDARRIAGEVRSLKLLVIRVEAVAIEPPQFLQRLVLDLADAFAADLQLLANLGQRVLVPVAETETELQDQLFPRRERVERRVDVPLEHRLRRRFIWGLRYIIGDQVAQTRLVFRSDRRLERDGALCRLHDLVDLLGLHAHCLGHFFRRRLATELLSEHVERLAVAGDRIAHVDRKTDGAALISDGASNRLANPPSGVGREPEALPPVVLLNRAHQPDVPLLDQVQQGQTAVDVALGDRHYKAQVRTHEPLSGIQIAHFDALGKIDLLRVRQQRGLGDLQKVETDGIVYEVRIESLQDVEIPLDIGLRLDLVGHLRLDLFGNVDPLVGDATDDEVVNLVHPVGLNRIAHQCHTPWYGRKKLGRDERQFEANERNRSICQRSRARRGSVNETASRFRTPFDIPRFPEDERRVSPAAFNYYPNDHIRTWRNHHPLIRYRVR